MSWGAAVLMVLSRVTWTVLPTEVRRTWKRRARASSSSLVSPLPNKRPKKPGLRSSGFCALRRCSRSRRPGCDPCRRRGCRRLRWRDPRWTRRDSDRFPAPAWARRCRRPRRSRAPGCRSHRRPAARPSHCPARCGPGRPAPDSAGRHRAPSCSGCWTRTARWSCPGCGSGSGGRSRCCPTVRPARCADGCAARCPVAGGRWCSGCAPAASTDRWAPARR